MEYWSISKKASSTGPPKASDQSKMRVGLALICDSSWANYLVARFLALVNHDQSPGRARCGVAEKIAGCLRHGLKHSHLSKSFRIVYAKTLGLSSAKVSSCETSAPTPSCQVFSCPNHFHRRTFACQLLPNPSCICQQRRQERQAKDAQTRKRTDAPALGALCALRSHSKVGTTC